MNTGTVFEGLMLIGGLGLIFIVLNAVFLGILYFTQRKMNAVAKWPYVMGTVKTSTTEYRDSGEGGAYYPVVHYSYQVSGQPFDGYRIAPGGEIGGVGAGKVAARYPVGSHVKVFYNPQKPTEAFLEKKARGQVLMWVILIIVDFSLCVFAPVMWWLDK
jgi:hypothetical protein